RSGAETRVEEGRTTRRNFDCPHCGRSSGVLAGAAFHCDACGAAGCVLSLAVTFGLEMSENGACGIGFARMMSILLAAGGRPLLARDLLRAWALVVSAPRAVECLRDLEIDAIADRVAATVLARRRIV